MMFGRTLKGRVQLLITKHGSNEQDTSSFDESFNAPPEDPKKVDYKASYRRQMEMYQWILRRKGHFVSDTGYFLYVDGQHVTNLA